MKSFGITLILVLLILSAGHSATFVVTCTDDGHDLSPGDGHCASRLDSADCQCTLRAAVEEANALPGTDTIRIDGTAGVYYLSRGPLEVRDSCTLIPDSDSEPVIDGLLNPFASDIFQLAGNHNTITRLIIRRAHRYGILVTGRDNVIGSDSGYAGSVITDCGFDLADGAGIALIGDSARTNAVTGNLIGMNSGGTIAAGNRKGILISSGSDSTVIESNIISGNTGDGIAITGSSFNMIRNNLIGPDITGKKGPGNSGNGIMIAEFSDNNLVGGNHDHDRNVISLNKGNGVVISASDMNTISGNHIGVDIEGINPLGNRESGIVIRDGATANTIGGASDTAVNVISSNGEHGVLLRGNATSENLIRGNLIGMDIWGIRSRGNGFRIGQTTPSGHGVAIDSGASRNIVGGNASEFRNVISANFFAGVSITGKGTHENTVAANFIGISVGGNSSAPNGTGVVIGTGASQNTIGGSDSLSRNVISGNRADIFPFGCGILVSGVGTQGNTIAANFIGLDKTGTRALRNGSSGVILTDGASSNVIGGATSEERNVIAGNGVGSFVNRLGRGIHLYGSATTGNRIIGNFIGTTANGTGQVKNIGHGIGIFGGAHDNWVGGGSADSGNLIALNAGHGIVVGDSITHSNLIRYNRMFDNDSLAIRISDSAQEGIRPPVLLTASVSLATGLASPPGSTVDLYKAASDPSGEGEGILLIGSGTVADNGSFRVTVSGLLDGDTVTAMVTDRYNNSSAFARNIVVGMVTTVEDSGDNLPGRFALHPNYPNPFNPSTTIEFEVAQRSRVSLVVYNISGQKVRTLADEIMPPGKHQYVWDGRNDDGGHVASGVYLVRLSTGRHFAGKKMLLLK